MKTTSEKTYGYKKALIGYSLTYGGKALGHAWKASSGKWVAKGPYGKTAPKATIEEAAVALKAIEEVATITA